MMGITILFENGEKINNYGNNINCYYKCNSDNTVVKLRSGLTFNYIMQSWSAMKDYFQTIKIA